MENPVIEAAMSALGSAFGQRAAELTVEQVRGWFESASQSVGPAGVLDIEHIDQLADSVLRAGTPLLDAEVTRKNLARWFEVPGEEFASTPPEHLEPEILIRHIYLENTFRSWLEEWGYEVTMGEDLEGAEGIDFTPDVYGKLTTLHGYFEVCVNFVCDDPPSQYRTRALLETLEAYATEGSEFKWGDLYVLATPFTFLRGTAASIALQSREERYNVVKLEATDLWELQSARDADSRLLRLVEEVDKAQRIGPQPTG